MDLNWRLRDCSRCWMCFFLLFIPGNVESVSGINEETDQSLDCTNDDETIMFCQIEAQNCGEYNLTIAERDIRVKQCIFHQCGIKKCCCSVTMHLVRGETHNVTVWTRNGQKESKIINVTAGIKPKTPEIKSVREFNTNFIVTWSTNYTDGLNRDDLNAIVTYHEKGGTKKWESKPFKPNVDNGLKFYEIPGRDLASSTTYVVSVKSQSSRSGRVSDTSEEKEFTTPRDSRIQILAIITGFSFAAIIGTCTAFLCCQKIKAKWRDAAAKCPKPQLLEMLPGRQKFQVLEPLEMSFSTVSVHSADVNSDSKLCGGDPQRRSGVDTSSSSPSSALAVQEAPGEGFTHLGAEESNSAPGFTHFDNMIYFIPVPDSLHEKMMDSSDVQTEAFSDSKNQRSEGDVAACPVLIFPPVDSSPMQTDMSYQPCNDDSGRFPCPEVSRLSSLSTADMTCDENPCYRSAPAGSHSFPAVDDNHQPFQNVAAEQRGNEENLDKYPEDSTR